MYHNANANANNLRIKPFVLSNIVKKYINLENEKMRKISSEHPYVIEGYKKIIQW